MDSKAWFGSISYRATDDFEVTLGARSIDESKSAYNSYTDFSFNPADGRVANPVYDDVSAVGYNEHDFRGLASIPGASYETPEKSWSETIITASASYRISDQSLAYASYSEGFRSGGFSRPACVRGSRCGSGPSSVWLTRCAVFPSLLRKSSKPG